MTIRTLILDDDLNSHKAACNALAAHSEVEIIGQFTESETLMSFLQSQPADLLFLDIELNEEFGFSVAAELKKTHPELMIVFLTGHSSYAIDGYDFQPVNFLTKPINPLKLEQTIREACRRMEQNGGQRPAQLMFQLQHGYRIIDVRDICYIERRDRKNFLHMSVETVRIAGYTMHELEEMLSEHGFFLCHQSFLISLYRVRMLRDIGRKLYEVELKDRGEAVPVSRNHYEALREQLKRLGMQAV